MFKSTANSISAMFSQTVMLLITGKTMFRLTPYQWKKSICYSVISALAFYPFSIMAQSTIDPPNINLGGGSAVCSGGSETIPLSITLPPDAVSEKVDVFFLFDDTGSFAPFVRTVTSIFSGLVGGLETALPGVEFGFGVGRFEDYGGPGRGFSGEVSTGRPFTLNQPIITAADVGGAAARDALINAALDRRRREAAVTDLNRRSPRACFKRPQA